MRYIQAVSRRSSSGWRSGLGCRLGSWRRLAGIRQELGAAQDLAVLDIDLAAITQAGGWKSPRMPLQYSEKINVGRSGMARAAEKTGRDSITE
jgi:hypothetical protein